MLHGKGRRMVQERRRGAHCGGRNREKTVAAVANNGEQNRRPGGILGARVWGKKKRWNRGLYRCEANQQIPQE